ncbi:MAG: NfeD family protein [Parvibaculum sp.]|nr:NfeD family protein [Parvibaculum sp.]
MDAASLFELAGRWAWFIAAACLGVIELLVPGILAIWLALAALGVGLLLLAVDLPLAAQLAIFAGLSVILVFASRQFLAKHPLRSDHPTLNQRGASYIGSILTVEQEILNGRGKVRVGDSVWLAEGEDAAPGTKVRVTGLNGSALVVERID